LTELNQIIIETLDQLLLYNSNDFPSMRATAFLALIARIKQIIDFNKAVKEELKEKEDFDWLFVQQKG
jgi:hypothetical protein